MTEKKMADNKNHENLHLIKNIEFKWSVMFSAKGQALLQNEDSPKSYNPVTHNESMHGFIEEAIKSKPRPDVLILGEQFAHPRRWIDGEHVSESCIENIVQSS